MKHYVSIFLKRLAALLEFFIALMLSIGIILLTLRMAVSLINIPDLNVWPNYDDLLETCFNLTIGVELIRMMYYHTPNTVFEVLLFAVARQIIIDHSSIWGNLIGVCAIAVLFATKAKAVTKILGVDIPYEEAETLSDVFLRKCEEFGVEVGVGACIYFNDCGLRAAKMHDEKISRIEVIRSIH